jgi:hypothetical protein
MVPLAKELDTGQIDLFPRARCAVMGHIPKPVFQELRPTASGLEFSEFGLYSAVYAPKRRSVGYHFSGHADSGARDVRGQLPQVSWTLAQSRPLAFLHQDYVGNLSS